MEVIEVDKNSFLASIKKIMWAGCLGYAICLLLSFVPILGFLASFGAFVFWIVGVVGLYQFSKFCNTFVFRFYIYNILLTFAYICVGLLLIIIFGAANFKLTLFISLLVLSIGFVGLFLYITYRMSVEMSYITALKEFMVAFKIYIIALVGIGVLSFVATIFVVNVEGLSEVAVFSRYKPEAMIAFIYETKPMTMLTIFALYVFLGIVILVSDIFLLLGVYRIKQVLVRPKSLENTESNP